MKNQHINYLAKIAVVGTGAALLQFAVFNILRIHTGPALANAISVELAIIFSFFLNNLYTFKDRKLKHRDGLVFFLFKLFQFNFFSLGSLLIQTLFLYYGVKSLGRGLAVENALVFCGIVIGAIYNYFIYQSVIWPRVKL